MTAVRGFAGYLAGIDPRTEVPPPGLVRIPRSWRAPFIYTDDDVLALMDAARRAIREPLRAATYETLIGLLAATGLRIGEALRLDRDDIDVADALLVIRRSKFGKSRQVPLHPSTMEALERYQHRRRRLYPQPKTDAVFVSLRGTRVIYECVWPTFRGLCDQAGIGADTAITPRIHDFRHSFAVRTLLDWYRAGVDVQSRLAWLSSYLGHGEPRYTYTYLSATPELLAHAARLVDDATTVGR
jgi:integrase